MSLLPNGQYKIFNTQFSGQDADLLGGQPTAAIAGYQNNTNSFNMVWNLTNVGNQVNQFTLTNAASPSQGAYASVDAITVGAGLLGSTNAITWAVIPTPNAGQYWILAPVMTNSTIPSGMVWALPGGADDTQITLTAIGPNDPSQAWSFVPWGDGDVGSMAKSLDELD
ncbi:hypothetical protein V8E55_002973 [Tylopilus felleus]